MKQILPNVFMVAIFFVLKISQSYSQPSIVWQDITTSRYISEHTFLESSGGEYIFAGEVVSQQSDSSVDVFIEKRFAENGNIIWHRELGSNEDDSYVNIKEDHEGNLYILSNTTDNSKDVVGFHVGPDYESSGGLSPYVPSSDAWLVKIDGVTGNIIWQRCVGGPGIDLAYDLILGKNQVYLLGITDSSGGDILKWNAGYDVENNFGNITTRRTSDIFVCHINPTNGNIIWLNTIGGTQTDGVTPGFTQTSDFIGGFDLLSDSNIVVYAKNNYNGGDIKGWYEGYTVTVLGDSIPNNDIWLVKISSNTGDTIWTDILGSAGNEVPRKVVPLPDNSFLVGTHIYESGGDVATWNIGYDTSIVLGDTFYIPKEDIWIAKIDANTSDVLWDQSLGGPGKDIFQGVAIDNMMDIILLGLSDRDGGIITDIKGKEDFLCVKLNGSNGDITWSKTYGGSEAEGVFSPGSHLDPILVDANDNICFAGVTQSDDGDVYGATQDVGSLNDDFWVVKVAGANGEMLWNTALGGNKKEELYNIASLCDGGYLLSGDTYTLLPNGEVTWSAPGGTIEALWLVKIDSLGGTVWDRTYSSGAHDEDFKAYKTQNGYLLLGEAENEAIKGDKDIVGIGQWVLKIDLLADFNFNNVCIGDTTLFHDMSAAAETWSWNFGDGGQSALQDPYHYYVDTGWYNVRLIVMQECEFDTVIKQVYVVAPSSHDSYIDSLICQGDTLVVGDSSGVDYNWSVNGDAISSNNSFMPVVDSGEYTLEITFGNNCVAHKVFDIRYYPDLYSPKDGMMVGLCQGDTALIQLDTTMLYEDIKWYIEDTLVGNNTTGLVWTADTTVRFFINIEDTFGCQIIDSVGFDVIRPILNLNIDNDHICLGDSIMVSISGVDSFSWLNDLEGLYLNDTTLVLMPNETERFEILGYDNGCENHTDFEIVVLGLPGVRAWGDTIIQYGGEAGIGVDAGSVNISWQSQDDLLCDTCSVLFVSPLEGEHYYVVVYDSNGCYSRDSVFVGVDYHFELNLPSAFSPNGDGVNDIFEVLSPEGLEVAIWIYDRWGNVIYFERGNGIGWDGRSESEQQEIGVYNYKYHIRDHQYNEHEGEGTVTLLR